ncbi:MAG: glycoside hydrolase family 88 protein [Rikenellaceae bacterium]
MKRVLTALIILATTVSCQSKSEPFTKGALEYCNSQILRTLDQITPSEYTTVPRNIAPGDTTWLMRNISEREWTAGFWPGVLWYGYEASGDERILAEAKAYTEAMESISQGPAYDHDLGFLMYCSYGNGYRLTGDEKYKDVIVATADKLATLFNPNVGTILSWPNRVERFDGHNTIIDNIMNLEMMFFAKENGGEQNLWDLSVIHADTTMKYHFREDGSSYHVVIYDIDKGGLKRQMTHQGYADDSMWARGQGWGIYGYTFCYRFTKDEKYLAFAQKLADLFLDRLPEDMIPYWDFDAPVTPETPRDASAAALAASALIELSDYVDAQRSERYFSAAEAILMELDKNYRSKSPALLDHSTGSHPGGYEIDYSIIYGDYYYIEALVKLDKYYASRK